MLTGHARDQVLAGVDGLGQIPELRTIAQVIGAHGQYDIQREFPLAPRLQQQLDEGGLVVLFCFAPHSVLDAEQFLELVHQDEEVFVSG